jgi:hypothetical protein
MTTTETNSFAENRNIPEIPDKVELRMVYGLSELSNIASFRQKYLKDYLLTEDAIEEDKKLDAKSIHVLYQVRNQTIGGIRFTDLSLKSCPVRALGVLDKINITINSNICEAGRLFLKPEFRSQSLKLLRMTSKLINESGKYDHYIAICHEQLIPLYNELTTINLANNISLPRRGKNYNLILGKF